MGEIYKILDDSLSYVKNGNASQEEVETLQKQMNILLRIQLDRNTLYDFILQKISSTLYLQDCKQLRKMWEEKQDYYRKKEREVLETMSKMSGN